MSLAALPHLAAENNPKKEADITAGKSLIERLIELGLKKKVLPAKRTKKRPASVEAGRFLCAWLAEKLRRIASQLRPLLRSYRHHRSCQWCRHSC